MEGLVSEQRELEVRLILPLINSGELPGWSVLSTFASDAANGAFLHSTYAPVPSRVSPVDCTHWLLPGPPDVWASAVLAKVMS